MSGTGDELDWDEPFTPGGAGSRAADGTGLDASEPAETAGDGRASIGAAVPWAGAEEGWTIQEVEARQVRPGWWCYAAEAARFVEVTYVTMTTAGRGRTVFADLGDGRTLALDERAVVLVRRPR